MASNAFYIRFALCELQLIYHKVFLCFFRSIGEVFPGLRPVHAARIVGRSILPGFPWCAAMLLVPACSLFSPPFIPQWSISKLSAMWCKSKIQPVTRLYMLVWSCPFPHPPFTVWYSVSPSTDCQKSNNNKWFQVIYVCHSRLHVYTSRLQPLKWCFFALPMRLFFIVDALPKSGLFLSN